MTMMGVCQEANTRKEC